MLSSAPTCDIGRGAAKAQAFHRGNVVVVLLRNPLTVLERTLVSDGRGSAVHHLREGRGNAMNVDITLADVPLRGVEEARGHIVLLDRILADAPGPALRRSASLPPHGLVEPS